MKISYAVVLSAFLTVIWSLEDLTFPPGFKFGVASSSYQVEGAWNSSDKTENIWDHFTRTRPECIKDGSTGDVACDSFSLWKRDVDMIAELGVHFYRFSINWPRLLPQGFATHVSSDGAKYYSDLIDALLEKGIEPILTLYHWELPMRLQRLGGWTNPLISDWFADYARVVYSLYGNRVKTWITINEPVIICDMAYNMGIMAPGILDREVAPYMCNKHVVMAHAKAYRIYDRDFREKYHGRVSLASQLIWFDPLHEDDEELAELARINLARTAHPIFSKEGGWPPRMQKIIDEKSRNLGYLRSSLPPFTKEEIEFVRGTFDFFAMNHYTSRLIRPARPGESFKTWPLEDCPDLNAIVEYHPTWNSSAASWFYVNPKGIRKQLVWLKKNYGNLDYLITENGFPSNKGLNDHDRIEYYRDYLKEVLAAIKLDGVNVTGYTAWTLMDNFEWMDGYKTKFGLYEVDFTSPHRTRTPRASARYYAGIVARHSLDVPEVFEHAPEVRGNLTGISKYAVSGENITNIIEDVQVSQTILAPGNGVWTGLAVVLIATITVFVIAVAAWRARLRNISAWLRETYASVKANVDDGL